MSNPNPNTYTPCHSGIALQGSKNFLKNVHFIGVGGIGMSGLAQFCLENGIQVQGSTLGGEAMLLQRLSEKGARIFRTHEKGRLNTSVDCVVVSSSITKTNPELEEAHYMGIPVLHRSDLLREILRHKKVLAISGTHGKTTTTSLLGHVLDQASMDPLIFSGGIMKNYHGNIRMGKSPWVVVEADESDKSFLNFSSLWASIITNIEAEHMENYGGCFANLLKSFEEFMEKSTEFSVMCHDDAGVRALLAQSSFMGKLQSYGLLPGAGVQGQNLRFYPSHTLFDVAFHDHGDTWHNVELSLKGPHNVLNALGVLTMARKLGISQDILRQSLAKFQGVERRLSCVGVVQGVTILDDYAHHPTEIAAVLSTLTHTLQPSQRLIAIVQPHRYSRLHALMDSFVTCFHNTHKVIVLPVYGASEEAIPGADGETLCSNLQKAGISAELADFCAQGVALKVAKDLGPQDVVICMGAGSITELAHELPAALLQILT